MKKKQGDIRYKFTVSYEGTNYGGWQKQNNSLTIQQVIESAFEKLLGNKITIFASSRTDGGVHARQQVFHCDLPGEKIISHNDIQRKLNAMLPGDIRIIRCARVTKHFHARYSVKKKEYRYFIWNADFLPPEKRFYYLLVTKPLSILPMKLAAKELIGEHDFSAFSANPNRHVESYVRKIININISKKGKCIIITIVANSFLYKMVRSIVGYLIKVGEGRLDPSTAKGILCSRIRTAKVPTAPPQGLFLWKIYY